MNKNILILIIVLAVIAAVAFAWHFWPEETISPADNGENGLEEDIKIIFSSERIYGYSGEFDFYPSGAEIEIDNEGKVTFREYNLNLKSGKDYDYYGGALTKKESEEIFEKRVVMEYESEITKEELSRVMDKFYESDFFALEEFYSDFGGIADYITIGIETEEEDHFVRYYGYPMDAPKSFQELSEIMFDIMQETVKPPVQMSIYAKEDGFVFKAETEKEIYLPQKGFFTPAYHTGAWKIYRLSEEEVWMEHGMGSMFVPEKVRIRRSCVKLWCKDACDTPPLGCDPIDRPPFCEKFSPGEDVSLEWDKTHIIEDEVVCNGKSVKCSEYAPVEPGKYMVVFSYKSDPCSEEGFFANNIRKVERNFNLGFPEELRLHLKGESFVGETSVKTKENIIKFLKSIDPEIEISEIRDPNYREKIIVKPVMDIPREEWDIYWGYEEFEGGFGYSSDGKGLEKDDMVEEVVRTLFMRTEPAWEIRFEEELYITAIEEFLEKYPRLKEGMYMPPSKEAVDMTVEIKIPEGTEDKYRKIFKREYPEKIVDIFRI